MTYWVWVTRPEYYLDESGGDLALGGMYDGGWWTCSAETKAGDYVLLYRTLPRSDIKYLLQAQTDAFLIDDGEFAGQWGCGFRAIETFDTPLTISEMRNDRILARDFTALRGRFHGRSFSVDPTVWSRLMSLLRRHNQLPLLPEHSSPGDIAYEQEMESRIAGSLDRLDIVGVRLEKDSSGLVIGRQRRCDVGVIDLLGRDPRGGWVVLEIKRGRIDRRTVGQILSYMGWVRQRLATPSQRVRGRVIGRGQELGVPEALSLLKDVDFLDYDRWK